MPVQYTTAALELLQWIVLIVVTHTRCLGTYMRTERKSEQETTFPIIIYLVPQKR